MRSLDFLLATLTAGALSTAIQAAEPTASKEAIQAGQHLFQEKQCSSCHTAGGPGESGKVDLDKYRLYADALLFGAVMWNHAPVMVNQPRLLENWPRFATGELGNLVAYIHDATGSKQHQYLLSDDATAGAGLFAERCGACHSVQAQGGSFAPDLTQRLKKVTSRAEIAAAMWNHVPQMVAVSKQTGVPLPKLDPKEMADLFSYLLSTLAESDRTALAAPTRSP